MDIILKRILECVGKKHGAKKELCDAIRPESAFIKNFLRQKKRINKKAP